jgi:hypothetical protein
MNYQILIEEITDAVALNKEYKEIHPTWPYENILIFYRKGKAGGIGRSVLNINLAADEILMSIYPHLAMFEEVLGFEDGVKRYNIGDPKSIKQLRKDIRECFHFELKVLKDGY